MSSLSHERADDYVKLFFHGDRLRVEVMVHGDDGWCRNRRTFDDWFGAYVYAVDLGQVRRPLPSGRHTFNGTGQVWRSGALTIATFVAGRQRFAFAISDSRR